jgi:hypothetical protein
VYSVLSKSHIERFEIPEILDDDPAETHSIPLNSTPYQNGHVCSTHGPVRQALQHRAFESSERHSDVGSLLRHYCYTLIPTLMKL